MILIWHFKITWPWRNNHSGIVFSLSFHLTTHLRHIWKQNITMPSNFVWSKPSYGAGKYTYETLRFLIASSVAKIHCRKLVSKGKLPSEQSLISPTLILKQKRTFYFHFINNSQTCKLLIRNFLTRGKTFLYKILLF